MICHERNLAFMSILQVYSFLSECSASNLSLSPPAWGKETEITCISVVEALRSSRLHFRVCLFRKFGFTAS